MSLYNLKPDLIIDATTKDLKKTILIFSASFGHLDQSGLPHPRQFRLVLAVSCTVRCQLSLSIFISPPERPR